MKEHKTDRGWWMLALLAGGLAGGCASPSPEVSIRREESPTADFSEVWTYQWFAGEIAPTARPRYSRTEIDEAVRAAVDAELQRKGMRRVDEDPDVLVGYSAAVDQDLDVSAVNLQYGYAPGMGHPMRTGPGYRRFTPGWSPESESVRFFERGALVLDILDAESRELLWRTSAQAELDRDLPGPERAERLEQTVPRMLEGFKE